MDAQLSAPAKMAAHAEADVYAWPIEEAKLPKQSSVGP